MNFVVGLGLCALYWYFIAKVIPSMWCLPVSFIGGMLIMDVVLTFWS